MLGSFSSASVTAEWQVAKIIKNLKICCLSVESTTEFNIFAGVTSPLTENLCLVFSSSLSS